MSVVSYNRSSYSIEVDDAEVRRQLGELSYKTPAVLKFAANATAREAKRLMVKEAKKRYAVNAKGLAQLNQLKQRQKATNANPTAELYIGGSIGGLRNDLAYFKTNPTRAYMGTDVANAPKVFRGKVLRDSGMKALGGTAGKSKAFLVTFKSGHTGMVQRVLGSKARSDTTAKGYKRWQPNEKLVTLGSRSAAGMHTTIIEQNADKVEAILEQKVQRRIEQILAKAGK